MNREYKATYDYLFDKEENLFYRDWRYFDKREANGKKVFWGRGNGWVLGGLVEILKELPKKDKNRKFYEELFAKLATRVAGLQHPDGFGMPVSWILPLIHHRKRVALLSLSIPLLME